MKRSEMVQLIKQAIIDGYIKADEILAVVEEAGMLPPSTKLKHLDVTDNAWEEE